MRNVIEKPYVCDACRESGNMYDLGGGTLTCKHSFEEMRTLVEESQKDEFHNYPSKRRLSDEEQRRHSKIALERLFSKSKK